MTREIQPLQIEIKTQDGQSLAGKFYSPDSPKKAVLIFGAIGVSQNYYGPLAKFLAQNACAVLTFDPRGMGESLNGSLSKVDADMFTWVKYDAEAALQALLSHVSNTPVTWIGHSVGGQMIPLTPSHNKVSKFITIASGSGWWKENSPELRKRVWMLWYGFVPLLTPIFGYFPGAKLNMVGNLPKGVILQWRRWCLNSQYLMGVEGSAIKKLYDDFRYPMTSLSFTDDEMMSERSINSLHGFYSSAPKKMLRFSPKELNRKRIGHFGFFRSEHKDLWERLILPELI